MGCGSGGSGRPLLAYLAGAGRCGGRGGRPFGGRNAFARGIVRPRQDDGGGGMRFRKRMRPPGGGTGKSGKMAAGETPGRQKAVTRHEGTAATVTEKTTFPGAG